MAKPPVSGAAVEPQQQQQQKEYKHAWQSCYYCPMQTFKIAPEFTKHLRERHCTKEGGSFVCRYGYNGVCASLPLDGVNDRDYETHVTKYHVNQINKGPEQWSVFSAAQNLPAVLNDPSRGKQQNLFTKKWGDTFIEKVNIPATVHLPDVNYNDFDYYMKKIGKRYRRHKRINQQLNESEQQSPYAKQLTTFSGATTSMSLRAYNELHDSSLKDIPQIFLKENLQLNNPMTFAQVFPGVSDVPNNNNSGVANYNTTADDDYDDGSSATTIKLKQKQSGRLLQEKLSYYLDIIEVHIAKQVSQKSSAFFHAMTSQDAIIKEMSLATINVKKLREKIHELDNLMVKNSFEIISLERTLSHRRIVLDKLKLMATVHQTQPMIQLLLGTQDYVAALDLISTTQEIVAQELIGIHCFKYLPSQLKEMERLIDKMLTTDFEKYTTTDLNRPIIVDDQKSVRNDRTDGNFIKDGINGDVNPLHKDSVNDDDDDDDDEEIIIDEDKLICIVSGLLRKKNFTFIDSYKEESICTIKALIKQMVIEIIATGDNEVCLTGGGEEAQILSISEWIIILDKATGTLLRLLKRIKSIVDVMHQIVDASAGHTLNDAVCTYIDTESVFLSEVDHRKVKSKLMDMLPSICNYCHERCANLISSQSLEQSIGTVEQIERLSQIIDHFGHGCEQLCGIQSVPLRAAIKIQGTRFAQKFHSERKSKLSMLLDNERWKQADVPAEFQQMIDDIAMGKFLWKKKSQSIDLSEDNNPKQNLETKPSPVLFVDTQPYALVGAALLLVQIVSEYCRCAIQLPIIAIQLSRHVVDLLRTFNSRCCQLVLGAGAMRVAGLKTITTANLALVSRALELVLWLLPHIKNHFKQFDLNGIISIGNNNNNNNNNNEHSKISNSNSSNNNNNNNNSTSLSGYDSVEKDFISHIKEIENKVLYIVDSSVQGQLSKWDARPPVPSQSFRNISKDLIKLHEVIASILPEHQIHSIYRVAHKNFKDKLRESLLLKNIINNGGPQHGIVTSELTFYMKTLRSINALPLTELNDNSMNDIWLQ